MPPRRKYRKPIKINSLIEETKMEILRGIYKDDSTIINKGADLLLGIEYDRGKIKSEHLEYLRDEALRIAAEKTKAANLIDDLLLGRIQAEKKEKKAKTDLRKIAAALIRENHIEWENDQPVIRTDKLVDMCARFSEEIGITVTPKMLLSELESQKKAMA